jgi:glycosyltransferase involved in cell wall biosynthesis
MQSGDYSTAGGGGTGETAIGSNLQAYGKTMKTNPKLSIVIPVFNEEENLRPLKANILEAMSSNTDPFEVVLVDDGSTDRSRTILQMICHEDARFRYLFFNRNHGQTAAFDAGFKAARGEIIITMDADMQTDACDIPLLLAELEGYDAVMGFRRTREDRWIKRISSRIANGIRNWFSGEDIRDVGCPLKAFRRDALQGIKLFNGMHRFFPTLLKLEGKRITEVGVGHYPRRHGQSKYNIRNRAVVAFMDLLAVCWMKRRALRYEIIEHGCNEKK